MHKQITREGFRWNYAIIKGYNRFVLRRFYKKYEVVGYKEHMIPDTPIIMAGNHQNALIDALNMVGSTKIERQPTFITRSDVFGHALTGFLYSLKMLPIYRERDNMPLEERIKKNEEIFNITVHDFPSRNLLSFFQKVITTANFAYEICKKDLPASLSRPKNKTILIWEPLSFPWA